MFAVGSYHFSNYWNFPLYFYKVVTHYYISLYVLLNIHYFIFKIKNIPTILDSV